VEFFNIRKIMKRQLLAAATAARAWASPGFQTVNNMTKLFVIVSVAAMALATPLQRTTAACSLPTPPKVLGYFSGDNTTIDTIGGHHGHFTGVSETYSTGVSGAAFDLHSSTSEGLQSVNYPHDDSWGFGENDFSIDLWVKFRKVDYSTNDDSTYFQAAFVGADDSAFSFPKWAFAIHSGKIAFHVNTFCSGSGTWVINYPLLNGTNNIGTNTWYHFALVRNVDMFLFYINGSLVGVEEQHLRIPNPKAGLTIGDIQSEGYAGDSGFNGLLDEVTIYGRALSPTEVSSIYSAGGAGRCPPILPRITPAGLVAWWAADGNTQEIFSRTFATANGGVSFDDGKVGEAVSLDGSSGYLEYRPTEWKAPSIEFTGPFAVEAWIKLSTLGQAQCIVAKGPDAEAPLDWALMVNADGYLRPHVNAGSWVVFNCETVLATNEWHHVAMVYDGAQVTGYVDGNADGSESACGAVSHSTTSMRIGAYAPINGTGSKCFFSGQIDEVSCYNRAVSETDIMNIFLAQETGKDFLPSWCSTSSLLAWWPAESCSQTIGFFTDCAQSRTASQTGTVSPTDGFVVDAFLLETNSYLTVSDDAELNPPKAITLECWVNRTSRTGIADPIMKKTGGESGEAGYGLEYVSPLSEDCEDWPCFDFGQERLCFVVHVADNWYLAKGPRATEDGEWAHVAGVFDGYALTCYVNGEPGEAVPIETPLSDLETAPDSPLAIGHDLLNSRAFNGRVDEPTVYCRALSPDEIKRIVSFGRDGKQYKSFPH